MLKFIIIFFLGIPSFLICDGNIIEQKTMDNKDTLLTTRNISDLWFGASFGISLDKNSGDFLLPLYPKEEYNISNPLRSFTSDWGYGIHFGLSAEYQINDYFGIGIKFNPLSFTSLDYSLSEEQQLNEYSNSIAFNYFFLLLTPELSVYLPETDFSLSLEFTLGKHIGTQATYITSFNNTSFISIYDELNIHTVDTYRAIAITLNYRLFYALIGNSTRLKLSPYLSFQHIPKIFETFGSHSSNNRINLGISISFGFDKLKYDTIPYREHKNSIEQIASGKQNEKVFKTKIDQKDKAFGIYESDFAESPPVDDYELDKNTLEYLNEILHIYKSDSGMKIEIKLNLPQISKDNEIDRKKNAIIYYLKSNGVNVNSIIQNEIKSKNINKATLEINIIY